MIKKDIIQPINDLIEKQAKELKDKIAYADEIENISYKNLNIETKNLSFYLNEKNLNPDDAASIILPNSVNWIVSCFAIIRLGCLVVPISYDSTLSENSGYLLEKHIKKIVKYVEDKTDIEILAIGIGHDVSRYYNRAIKITDVNELGDVMISQLSVLFDKKSQFH